MVISNLDELEEPSAYGQVLSFVSTYMMKKMKYI